jgi:hypothetical protein
MDWLAFWDKWGVWILALGGVPGAVVGVPIVVSNVLKAYDHIIWFFFGANVIDTLRAHKIQRWHQLVEVDVLASEIKKTKFLTLRSLHYLRREGRVILAEGKWRLPNPED